MKILNKYFILFIGLCVISCSDETYDLTTDYQAPQELPSNLVAGTPLTDRILELYDDYGIIVYSDTIGTRNYHDIVSEDPLQMEDRIPADTSAAMVYLDMIVKEFINLLPEENRNLIFRNFYLYKNSLSTGTTAYNRYDYISYLWYNSNSDLTVGGIDKDNLDSLKLKQSFYYGLSTVLRNDPFNRNSFYDPFVEAKTDEAVYYWQVTSLETAYETGFVSEDQNFIKSDPQDFDLIAAWAATVKPTYRDSILNKYSFLREKYDLVTGMFRKEGIPLEAINEEWQNSAYNPENY